MTQLLPTIRLIISFVNFRKLYGMTTHICSEKELKFCSAKCLSLFIPWVSLKILFLLSLCVCIGNEKNKRTPSIFFHEIIKCIALENQCLVYTECKLTFPFFVSSLSDLDSSSLPPKTVNVIYNEMVW